LVEEVSANEIKEKQRELEVARRLRHQQEAERKKQDKKEKMALERKVAEEMYLNKDTALLGKVDQWRGTYGFIRSKGVARKLGRVFFHRSNVVGHEQRRYFRNGTELLYKLVNGRDPGTYKAVEVTLVPQQQSQTFPRETETTDH